MVKTAAPDFLWTLAQKYHPTFLQTPINIVHISLGSRFQTFITRTLTLNIGLHRDTTWKCVQINVKMSVLGADPPSYFNLSVNMYSWILLGDTVDVKITGKWTFFDSTDISATQHHKEYTNILDHQYQCRETKISDTLVCGRVFLSHVSIGHVRI